MSLQSTLKTNRSLAIQVNPRPFVTHKLKVLGYLRLEEGFEPEGVSVSDWKTILDHFDGDGSTSLQRGVFYLEGDIAEVDRYEAADLLSIFPSYFEPVDDLSIALVGAIGRGAV